MRTASSRWASFQSTPPTQGSDMMPRWAARPMMFQSTPPTQGSDQAAALDAAQLSVSIHAPHAGERR